MSRELIVDVVFDAEAQSFAIIGEGSAISYREFCGARGGKGGHMILREGNRTRSLRQNAYFHGPVVQGFMRLMGVGDPDYIKAYLKGKFLRRRIMVTEKGELVEREYTAETSSLSVAEMSEFIDNCLNHLFDEGGHLLGQEGREWQEIRSEPKGGPDETASDADRSPCQAPAEQ